MVRYLLGFVHRLAKLIIQGQSRIKVPFTDGQDILKKHFFGIQEKKTFLNELHEEQIHGFTSLDIFPTENLTNIVIDKSILGKKKIVKRKIIVKSLDNKIYINLLKNFINDSKIPSGWKNSGLHYAGYIADYNNWCLPSWVWINGAIARYYFTIGDHKSGLELADRLIELQLPKGGWMVRYDFMNFKQTVSPIIAPNDSAYIASNALLNAYMHSVDEKYLISAEKCAQWIMDEGNLEGMVLIGYDPEKEQWKKDHNIVDVGFTADLFCKLYKITGKEAYSTFAKTFIDKYVNFFYLGAGKFATSINSKTEKIGGVFARGQAWALEGLIPYYEISKDPTILKIINAVVHNIMLQQKGNGGWLHNLRPDVQGWITGYDNKGIPIIANALLRCIEILPDEKENLLKSINKSINWCKNHTYVIGELKGLILSNNFEGAIVHSFYTSTAFVYSNCYLIETILKLEETNYGGNNA